MGVFDLFLSAKVQKRRTCRLATPRRNRGGGGEGGGREGWMVQSHKRERLIPIRKPNFWQHFSKMKQANKQTRVFAEWGNFIFFLFFFFYPTSGLLIVILKPNQKIRHGIGNAVLNSFRTGLQSKRSWSFIFKPVKHILNWITVVKTNHN